MEKSKQPHHHHLITIGLWFDAQAEEAARFYTGTFKNARMGDITYYGNEGFDIHGGKPGTVMTASFTLGNLTFVGINGGPLFKINPSISFFVVCETDEETNALWKTLSEKGRVLMPLDTYPWSRKYGWLSDRYGLSWQIATGNPGDTGGQQVTPSLLYTGAQHGKARQAIEMYTAVFKNAGITGVREYKKGDPEPEGTIQHAQFTLEGQTFMAMDSKGPHDFHFTEGVSLIVNCETQEEIDYYWEKLGEDGDPEARQCGWLKDRFGVSWQVNAVPLQKMLMDKDKTKTARVTKVFLQMKKFDLAALEKAFGGK